MRALTSPKLPIVDLTGLWLEDPQALLQVSKDIRAACLSSGFFYITNYQIPACLIQQVLDETARLFALPPVEKESMSIKNSKHMRGYFGFGEDRSDGVNGDLKEGFDLGLDLPLTDELVQAQLPFHGPNIWPDGLPGFKQALAAYYDHMLKLGLGLLRAFGVGLGLNESYFDAYFTKPIAQLRLLRYPGCEAANPGGVGAGEHTDFGCLTVILQDQTGGLEIKGDDGAWISVPAIPGTLVVNIGDLMQRWTNNMYLATMHRVVNRAKTTRYSAAFFMDPDYHTVVECLPSCVSIAKPPGYAPVVFGNYIDTRYRETTTFSDGEIAA